MISPTKKECKRPAKVAVMATGLLALWAAFHLLAAVPVLHHVLHHDSSDAGHACPVTSFASACGEVPHAVSVLPMRFAEWSLPLPQNISMMFGCLDWEPHGPRPPPLQFSTFTSTGSARV